MVRFTTQKLLLLTLLFGCFSLRAMEEEKEDRNTQAREHLTHQRENRNKDSQKESTNLEGDVETCGCGRPEVPLGVVLSSWMLYHGSFAFLYLAQRS